jgi:glutamate--cysteine ligase catalytic subunit
MGLLSVGTPLEWKDAEKYSDHVRKHGIEVFALKDAVDGSNF